MWDETLVATGVKKRQCRSLASRPASHLHMDPVLGLLAVKHSLDIKVGAPSVFLNRRAHPLSLTGDDCVWIHSCREENGSTG